VFLSEQCAVSKLTTSVQMQSFGLDTNHNCFATRLLPCRWYVFVEVSPDIRCSDVPRCCCCYV